MIKPCWHRRERRLPHRPVIIITGHRRSARQHTCNMRVRPRVDYDGLLLSSPDQCFRVNERRTKSSVSEICQLLMFPLAPVTGECATSFPSNQTSTASVGPYADDANTCLSVEILRQYGTASINGGCGRCTLSVYSSLQQNEVDGWSLASATDFVRDPLQQDGIVAPETAANPAAGVNLVNPYPHVWLRGCG